MKKLIPFALSFTLFALILSCGGDGGKIVTPKAVAPKVELTVSSTSIPFGGKVLVSWVISNATGGGLNGEFVLSAGNKEFQLTETTNFALEAVNDGITVSKTINVVVGSWKDNKLGLLNHQGKHWVIQDTQIIQNGEVVAVYPPAQSTGEYYVYYIDGAVGLYDVDNNLYWYPLGDYKWKFIENETKLQWFNNNGAMTLTILKLTETDLSLSRIQEDYGGSPATIVENWIIEE